VSEGIRALRHHPQAHADDGLSAKAAAQLGPAAFRAMHERLLHAYFAENRDITKGETLQPLWAETGLPYPQLLDRLPNGRCRARVTLQLRDSEDYTAEAEGLTSQAGELRCAAQACVMALTKAVQGAIKFELLGVKAVRAFDANVVIVSLSIPTEREGPRLVGCFLTEEDTPRGAALAVLNATNRVLGNRLFMR